MNVDISTVKKLHITGVEHFDPIGIFIEDYDVGQAKVTIEQAGDSWSYYWSHMGDYRAIEFLKSCSYDYLIGKFSPQLRCKILDTEAMKDYCKREIILKRKGAEGCYDRNTISPFDAEYLWSRVKNEDCDPYRNEDLMYEIFGSDWWDENFPHKDNPKYLHLKKVINTIKEALNEIPEDELMGVAQCS